MKKDLNFELNLIPIIALLSVCICFLLVVAIWVHVGTLDIKQAIGPKNQQTQKKNPVMWVNILKNGTLKLSVEHAPKLKGFKNKFIKHKTGTVDFESLLSDIQSVKAGVPSLTTAFIVPNGETLYEDVIQIMDYLKQEEIMDLGVTPL